MIDLHSHILPGIDDGASDIDASVVLLRELAAGGVTDVVATPHYIDETIYASPCSENKKLLRSLKTRLKKEGIDMKVHLGNEIYIMPKILDFLKNGVVSGLAGSKYLLIELPMSGEFPGYADIFLEILRAGYFVVLAHPERYTAFQKDFDLISDLCEMGVLLQCNVGSFAGQYGKSAFKLARRLAKERMIFAVGTDIHHPHGNDFLPNAIRKMSKYYNDLELSEILTENPRKILAK